MSRQVLMMSNRKILHIFNDRNIFSKEFFKYLHDNNFELSQHYLFHYGCQVDGFEHFNMPFTFSSLFSVTKHIKLLKLMFSHDRLLIHSLASPWLLVYLYLFPDLNKKVYWVVWGKDLYYYKLLNKKRFYHEIYEFFRRRVFPRIGHIITIQGDYDLAVEWYGVKGERHEVFMYPHILHQEYGLTAKPHSSVNIMVGNSADPSNNHLEIFEKLVPHISKDIKIMVPISYGDRKHAHRVLDAGRRTFGDKFEPLMEFLPHKEYMKVLADVDIAIFNHKRQQAMSNITTLIGLGKKVYIRSDQSTWSFFESHGMKVFDSTGDIELDFLDEETERNNKINVRLCFSRENYLRGLQEIL